jgi:cell division septum initiation protein DivIVA
VTLGSTLPGRASWPLVAPIDLREHDLPTQAALGFHRRRTQELLARAADTIEQLSRELSELRTARERWRAERDRLEETVKEETTRAERLVGEAMLDAHKAGQALRAEAEAKAEDLQGQAEALLESAKQEAQRLVADAREQARELVAGAEAERDRLAAQGEQYTLLAADVQRRAVEVLRHALGTLEGDSRSAEGAASDEVAPFRTADLTSQ